MILTERRLRQAASEVKSEIEHSSIAKRMFAYDSAIHYDLFISHSFKDKELVTGLYHLFYKANYKVYIDWIDDTAGSAFRSVNLASEKHVICLHIVRLPV